MALQLQRHLHLVVVDRADLEGSGQQAAGDEAALRVETDGGVVAGRDRERQRLQPCASRGVDGGGEETVADALPSRLGSNHHADDMAEVAHLAPRLALAADGADEAIAMKGAEQEVATVGAVEAESLQVLGRLLGPLCFRVRGEGFGMGDEHLVAQPFVGWKIGCGQWPDSGEFGHGGAAPDGTGPRRSAADVMHLDATGIAGQGRGQR